MIHCLDVILLGCWGGTAVCSVHKWTSYFRRFFSQKGCPEIDNLLRIIRKCTLTWMSQNLSKWLINGLYVTTYLLISGVYWGYNPTDPFTFDPSTSGTRDIQQRNCGIFRCPEMPGGPLGSGGSPFCRKLSPQKSNQKWRVYHP